VAEVRQDTQPAALRVPDPQLPTKIPAGRRSSIPTLPPAPGGQPDPNSDDSGNDPPLIDSSAAAAQALCAYFLANADRGDNAANDELVAELVRRIRIQQASGKSGR
jgi:hypothetical protein